MSNVALKRTPRKKTATTDYTVHRQPSTKLQNSAPKRAGQNRAIISQGEI